MKEPELISRMQKPDFYRHRVERVDLIETHISYVLLAGEYVYKIKKAVRFPFLDASSKEKRRHFCEEEVRLNRRLAPRTYLGVLPIFEHNGEFSLGEASGQQHSAGPVEYAVKMRRLAQEQMLDHRLRAGKAGAEEIYSIARKLVSFHRAAAGDKGSVYGSWDAVRRLVTENFDETAGFVGETLTQTLLDSLRQQSLGFLRFHRPLFAARAGQGKIKDGHGDLRAEHICLTRDIEIFDCIEFNEGFRYCDVASEIAFLAMDMDFLGAAGLAERLVTAYRDLTNDQEMDLLVPFYKGYRAMIRGKVESIRAKDEEAPSSQKEEAAARAARYFRLAHHYLGGPVEQRLVVVCGLVAAGKSTVAAMLREFTGFRLLRSDVLRKRIAGVAPTRRARQVYREGLYSDSMTRRTYGALQEQAVLGLKEKDGVIVDATCRDASQRKLFLQAGEAQRVPVLFIECRASEEEVFRRLRAREEDENEVSDATAEVYLAQKREFTPMSELPHRCHFILDTDTDLQQTWKRLERRLLE